MNPSQSLNPEEGSKPTTVLVVDDEVLVRTVIADALRDEGYTAIEAANGAEALSILNSDVQIDLLLTDFNMPGDINGARLIKLARAENPHIKAVLMSSVTPSSTLDAPLDGFLLKPYEISKLYDLIKELAPQP